MTTEVGAKSGHCGCFDCFRPPETKITTIEGTPRRGYTNREIKDFQHLVKADQEDPEYQEEKRTTAELFKKIHPTKMEKKDE